jgi:hypothetical protein
MYCSGPSSKVNATVLGTSHLVISCARGVARPVRASISVSGAGVGEALTRRAEETKATAVNTLDNMISDEEDIGGKECGSPQRSDEDGSGEYQGRGSKDRGDQEANIERNLKHRVFAFALICPIQASLRLFSSICDPCTSIQTVPEDGCPSFGDACPGVHHSQLACSTAIPARNHVCWLKI